MPVKRILSGIVLTGLGLLLIYYGGWIYTIGVSLLLAGGVWEFILMFRRGKYNPNPWIPFFGSFVYLLSLHLAYPNLTAILAIATIIFIMIRAIIAYPDNEKTTAFDLTIELASLLFVTFLGGYLIHLRDLAHGLIWIMVAIFPVCFGDICAYVIGSLFGKHLLAPKLSPHKTVEGYISGVLIAIISGLPLGLIAQTMGLDIPVSVTVFIAAVVGTLSPMGDLAKSIFKRSFHLDNTGSLIPGHGGVIDRIDSWLWAAPVGFYLILILS